MEPRKKLRSSIDISFSWKSCCFLCNKKAERKYSTVVQVRTIPLLSTLIAHCNKRDDEWGKQVQGRLLTCNDLVAADAIYHISCMTSFRLQTQSSNKRGRPANTAMMENFNRIRVWLEEEADSDLYTLAELHNKMIQLGEDSPCYSVKSMKRKLSEYYGEHIFFGELPGRPNLVCFKDMASFILEKFKKTTEQTPNDIIAAAAKIIKSNIREISSDKSEYPALDELGNIDYAKNWVDIDKSFATKWLVDHLAKFGFSISSDEVKLFKQSAAQSGAAEPFADESVKFTQWVADNVDHNICTLTGKGMGIISISSSSSQRFEVIKRLKHNTACDYTEAINILPYHGSSHQGLLKLNFKSIKDLQTKTIGAPEMNLDLLWQTAWLFSSKENPRPNWSGFMQHATCSRNVFEKASVTFLPIIDLNPSDEICINSTLHFVINQAVKFGINTPCITFDQPLWQKAVGIIEDLEIVCRLGRFHTLMSFLGSIGKLMACSGLEDIFEEIYAEHTVTHMLTGKAVSRSLRAHLLVQGALMSHIINGLVDEKKIDSSKLESIYITTMEWHER